MEAKHSKLYLKNPKNFRFVTQDKFKIIQDKFKINQGIPENFVNLY